MIFSDIKNQISSKYKKVCKIRVNLTEESRKRKNKSIPKSTPVTGKIIELEKRMKSVKELQSKEAQISDLKLVTDERGKTLPIVW